MRYICVQPAIPYYTWQVEVMINNFKKQGINPNHIDIVCGIENGVIPHEWSVLANHYNTVRFFFYSDTRQSKNYISSIRPNILKQHFTSHPYLSQEVVFYHDCDIVFTKPVNFNKLESDDIFYGSDTVSYIGHNYILSKGEDVLDKMCEIADIDKQLVKDNELNSIGAQYMLKNIDHKFWEKVEDDSERLFKEITDLNNIKKAENPEYHELQIWCADMWAVLWNIWKLGKKTACHTDLEFAWATSHVDQWNKLNIYHNAGVTDSTSGYFYKADYMDRVPYNDILEVSENSANYFYWKEVQETAKHTVLV